MKYWLTFVLSCCLIFGMATISWASFLFEPELGLGTLQVEDQNYPADQSTQMFYVNNNVDIFLVRLGLEAGYANGSSYDFLNLGAGVTLRIPTGGINLLAGAGYQGFLFYHSSPKFMDSFWGTLLGAGVEIPIIDALSLNAIYYYPVTRKYYQDLAFISGDCSQVTMEYYKVSLYYNLPLLDIFLNFRGIGAGYKAKAKEYTSYSCSLGCKIGF